jgi:hypothetical protein
MPARPFGSDEIEGVMFSSLLTRLFNLVRGAAAPVDCPSCGHRFKPHAGRELAHWRELFERFPCPKCGYRFGIGEDAKSMVGQPAGPVAKPAGSRIEKLGTLTGGMAYFLPAGKHGAGLIGFALFLNVFLLPLFYFLVVKGGMRPKGPRVIITLMAGASVAMLYGGLRQRFATHQVELGPEFVKVRRKFLLPWTQKMETRKIESVRRSEAYSMGGGEDSEKPAVITYALELRAGFKTLRFGSGLEPQEQLWLAWEIREYLRGHGATGLLPEPPVNKERSRNRTSQGSS